jgi:LemA protein
VTDARAGAVAADNAPPGQRAQAESALSAALGGIRVVAEQYPQLRAAENFTRLQAQLAEVEDEIQASRRIYNSNAQIYNTRQQVFPNSIVAARGDFRPREFFEIEAASDREVPQVSFSS